MSRFRVTNPDGSGGVDNRAIEIDRSDPVQLNAYGLYTKRDSTTNPPSGPIQHAVDTQRKSSNTEPGKSQRETSRKISLGFAQWTR